VPKNGSSFIGGVAQLGNNLDHPEFSGKAVLHITEEQRRAEVWGRFGQESRSFGRNLQPYAFYAIRAKPYKH
jgi:hypothetical protein